MRKKEAKPKIISIVGLTASGKSSLGIKIAQLFDGEIISADSRQVYKGLDLGSGKVTQEEQDMAVHHMLDVACPLEYSKEGKYFDVFAFQQLAYKTIDDILARGKVPIIVGGTGLYSRSVVEGYAFEETGKKNKSVPKYEVLQIALMPTKEWLLPRVELRLDQRLEEGMLDELKDLLAKGVDPEWLKALGLEYYWNTAVVQGEITKEEYRRWLVIRIMQFAKRQRTWFKKEQNTVFLQDDGVLEKESVRLVKEFLRD